MPSPLVVTSVAAGDGQIQTSATATWALAKSSAGGTAATTSNTMQVAAIKYTDSWWQINRLFLPFSLSAVPLDATVVSATIDLFSATTDPAGLVDCRLIQSTQASPTALVSSDFTKIAMNLMSDAAFNASTVDYTKVTVTLNAAGIAALQSSIGGYAKFAVVGDCDYANVTPTSVEHSTWCSANHATVGYRPTLTVVYTVVTGTPPSVTLHPVSGTYLDDDSVSLSSTATGEPSPTIQWQRSTTAGGSTFEDIAGATSSPYVHTADENYSGYLWRAKFVNTAGTTYSNAATLTINPIPLVPPSFTSHPLDTSAMSAFQAEFSAQATGFPDPTYQWQRSTTAGGDIFEDIIGETSNTYSFTVDTIAAEDYDGFKYRVAATNSSDTAYSTPAVFSVVYSANPLTRTEADDIYGRPVYSATSISRWAGAQYSDGYAIRLAGTNTVSMSGYGSSVRVRLWKQPSAQSIALISVDGVLRESIDCYAATEVVRDVFIDGLTLGNHIVEIENQWTPELNARYIYVDFFEFAEYQIDHPVVQEHPTSQDAVAGHTLTLKTSASGLYGTTVKWQRSTTVGGSVFEDIVGATSDTYSFIPDDHEGYLYRSVFTNSHGQVPSLPAQFSLVNILSWDGGTPGIKWGNTVPTCTGYQVFRNGALQATLGSSVFYYYDNTAQSGVLYEYAVEGIGDTFSASVVATFKSALWHGVYLADDSTAEGDYVFGERDYFPEMITLGTVESELQPDGRYAAVIHEHAAPTTWSALRKDREWEFEAEVWNSHRQDCAVVVYSNEANYSHVYRPVFASTGWGWSIAAWNDNGVIDKLNDGPLENQCPDHVQVWSQIRIHYYPDTEIITLRHRTIGGIWSPEIEIPASWLKNSVHASVGFHNFGRGILKARNFKITLGTMNAYAVAATKWSGTMAENSVIGNGQKFVHIGSMVYETPDQTLQYVAPMDWHDVFSGDGTVLLPAVEMPDGHGIKGISLVTSGTVPWRIRNETGSVVASGSTGGQHDMSIGGSWFQPEVDLSGANTFGPVDLTWENTELNAPTITSFSISNDIASVSFVDNASYEEGHEVQASIDGGVFSLVDSTPLSDVSFALPVGCKTLQVRVAPYVGSMIGEFGYSSLLWLSESEASYTNDEVTLTWNTYPLMDFVQYTVYRHTSPNAVLAGEVLTTITNQEFGSFLDTTVEVDTTYYYVIVTETTEIDLSSEEEIVSTSSIANAYYFSRFVTSRRN